MLRRSVDCVLTLRTLYIYMNVERMWSGPVCDVRTCEIAELRQHLHFLSKRD